MLSCSPFCPSEILCYRLSGLLFTQSRLWTRCYCLIIRARFHKDIQYRAIRGPRIKALCCLASKVSGHTLAQTHSFKLGWCLWDRRAVIWWALTHREWGLLIVAESLACDSQGRRRGSLGKGKLNPTVPLGGYN